MREEGATPGACVVAGLFSRVYALGVGSVGGGRRTIRYNAERGLARRAGPRRA